MKFKHKILKSDIYVFYNVYKDEYIVDFFDKEKRRTYFLKNINQYVNFIEKITFVNKKQIKKLTAKIPLVNIEKNYSESYGYIKSKNVFNIAEKNIYYNALLGEKPKKYSSPDFIVEFLKNSFGEDFEYFIASLKYRYKKFLPTNVITYILCKDISLADAIINIACAGFEKNIRIIDLFHFKKSISSIEADNVIVYGKKNLGSFAESAFIENIKTKIFIATVKLEKIHKNKIDLNNFHFINVDYTVDDFNEFNNKIEHEMLNFYYWLGNECDFEMSHEEYTSTASIHQSQSYSYYVENVNDKYEKSINLLTSFTFKDYIKFLMLNNLKEYDIEHEIIKNVYRVNASHLRMKTEPEISEIITKLIKKNEYKRYKFASGTCYYLSFTNHSDTVFKEIETEEKANAVKKKNIISRNAQNKVKRDVNISRDELRSILKCIGYSYISITKILSRERKPSLQKAIDLQKEYGYPVTMWDNWIRSE